MLNAHRAFPVCSMALMLPASPSAAEHLAGEPHHLPNALLHPSSAPSFCPASPRPPSPQESVRSKVVRQALEQLNSALRQYKGMAKNFMSGTIQAAVRGLT